MNNFVQDGFHIDTIQKCCGISYKKSHFVQNHATVAQEN